MLTWACFNKLLIYNRVWRTSHKNIKYYNKKFFVKKVINFESEDSEKLGERVALLFKKYANQV